MTLPVQCPYCSHTQSIEFISSVNTEASPELKEKVSSGELFTWECASCGKRNLASNDFLYHDPKEKLMILLTSSRLSADSLPEGYTGRIVRSVGELIEKIKIFDSGLDDIVMELCKFVTVKELGKDIKDMKFFMVDGADSELTLTYPENGKMEMIAIGFNVYEDCAGIIRRNPVIKESARALTEVNPDWISKFFA